MIMRADRRGHVVLVIPASRKRMQRQLLILRVLSCSVFYVPQIHALEGVHLQAVAVHHVLDDLHHFGTKPL